PVPLPAALPFYRERVVAAVGGSLAGSLEAGPHRGGATAGVVEHHPAFLGAKGKAFHVLADPFLQASKPLGRQPSVAGARQGQDRLARLDVGVQQGTSVRHTAADRTVGPAQPLHLVVGGEGNTF